MDLLSISGERCWVSLHKVPNPHIYVDQADKSAFQQLTGINLITYYLTSVLEGGSMPDSGDQC